MAIFYQQRVPMILLWHCLVLLALQIMRSIGKNLSKMKNAKLHLLLLMKADAYLDLKEVS